MDLSALGNKSLISKPPSLFQRKPILYLFRSISFLSVLVLCSIAINAVQAWGFLFLFALSRPFYRLSMRFTQRLFGILILFCTFLYSPLQIVLTGAHQELNQDSFAPIMANHQIYTDWWYIWIFSCFRNAHGDLKIILKESIGSLPVFGWGMRCFEFIFLSRKWDIDRPRIISSLERAKKDGTPMWLLVFPEGTVNTQNTRSIAEAFAKKSDIVFNTNHVILPRSTGLFHILRCLEGKSEYLYDFTIGYTGLKADSIPYDEYPIDKVFFEGAGPEAIHIHVDKYKLSDIPGLSCSQYDPLEKPSAAFEEWLRTRFLEKDQLLDQFFATGKFPQVAKSCASGLEQTLEVSRKTQDWITICGLVFASITSLTWLFFY